MFFVTIGFTLTYNMKTIAMNKPLTSEEHKELIKLKHIRSERGFLVPVEQQRFDELINRLSQRFVTAMKKIEETQRLQIMN